MRILFVCLGNICRSPTAEGVMHSKLAQAGLAQQVSIDSAGTAAWHSGKQPDPRTRAAASRRGYDLDGLRARAVEPADFERFDLILAMDQENLRNLRRMQPQGSHAELDLFLRRGGLRQLEVPDPYYGGEDGFERVLDMVELASDNLIALIRERL